MPRDTSAEARLATRNRRIGEWLEAVENGRGGQGIEDGVVTRVTIRLPTREDPEALLVVKVTAPDGDHIGFVGGLGVNEALLTWRARDASRGLKWRADVPWKERQGG